MPTWTDKPVIKQLTQDWQISGIFRMLSGQALTPSCSSNTAGINNSNPTLTDGVPAARPACELTGEPIFSGYTVDTSLPGSRPAALQPRRVPHAAAERQRRQLRQHPSRHPPSPDLARVGPDAVAPLPDQPDGTQDQRRPPALRGLQRVQRGAVHQLECVVHLHDPGGRAAEFVEHQRQHRQVHRERHHPRGRHDHAAGHGFDCAT